MERSSTNYLLIKRTFVRIILTRGDKYVVPVFIDYEKQIVQLQRFDERIFDINIEDIVFCEVMI
ncbi:hypothetical protein E4S97_15845 [Listeria monocytogenes]|nr:hypothetical protein [Listeria monocytogenes]